MKDNDYKLKQRQYEELSKRTKTLWISREPIVYKDGSKPKGKTFRLSSEEKLKKQLRKHK